MCFIICRRTRNDTAIFGSIFRSSCLKEVDRYNSCPQNHLDTLKHQEKRRDVAQGTLGRKCSLKRYHKKPHVHPQMHRQASGYYSAKKRKEVWGSVCMVDPREDARAPSQEFKVKELHRKRKATFRTEEGSLVTCGARVTENDLVMVLMKTYQRVQFEYSCQLHLSKALHFQSTLNRE